MLKMNFSLFVLLLLLVPIYVRSLNPSLNDDILGLIVFKADLEDPNGKLVSWNEDDDSCCNWAGVKCDPRSNRVVELVLDGFSLSGKIGKGLVQLQFLRKLSLAKNNLTGDLSPVLTRLENLMVLDLSENSLSGSLPVPGGFFQQCGSLRSVSLAFNGFSGQIPGSLSSCSNLAALNLSSNQFMGPLPSGVWSLKGLRSLDLSNNQLAGEIPKGIEGMSNLRAINLGTNKFTGEVPGGIGRCLLLRSIDLSENSLSGNLPGTMKKLVLCNALSLRKNSFGGGVPDWLGEMTSLETLDLSDNSFSGQVPSSTWNLQSLKVLNFSRNGLTGSLPESNVNCKNVLSMDFSHNLLTGSLPGWIFQLGVQEVLLSGNRLNGSMDSPLSSSPDNSRRKLLVLDLSYNAFSGNIPSSVGDFSSLQVLDLSKNRLDGSIPLEIGRAISLKELRLEKNSLGGTIPTSIENCSSLTSLILSRNYFYGPLPTAIAQLTNLQIVDLSFNRLTGTLPKQLANLGHLLSFNISHNQLQGALPGGSFFNTISPSSVAFNPSLCGAAVNRTCPTVLPKPIVLNPEYSDSPPGSMPQNLIHKKSILSISSLIAIGAAAVIVIGVIVISVLNLRARSPTSRSAVPLVLSGGDDFSRSSTTDANSGKLVMFSGVLDFSTGAHALLNKDCELGRGGFGAVYKTVLKDGTPVAIKKLTVSSLVKSQEEFEREVKKLGKIRHCNLVSLEGYYWTPSLQLLIYELISGGSLYQHLHDEDYHGKSLSWKDRFRVILGIAKSLAHLHKMNIIHYNLKSSNILIDSAGEPKVADFGLARLLPMLDRYVLSKKINGALGYMAPEFACRTVKITDRCDVYGFGVLVLEVVTGKVPVEYMEDDMVVLCDMVRGALEEGRVEECVDKRLQGDFPADEVIPLMKLGLICTSQVPSNRPDMGEVVNILELIRYPPSEDQDELMCEF